MRGEAIQSDILRYILENGYRPGDALPTIQEISQALDISVAKARESLEIARMMGVVEIKPGRGTRVAQYRLAPSMTLSALYAIRHEEAHFEQLRAVRKALEIQFWEEAVAQLTPADIETLRTLVQQAELLLAATPIQVPAREHRAFHLTIYTRLENPFVTGILESFWDVYEAVGLNHYRELAYHQRVWQYHSWMVDAIAAGEVERGRQLLIEHMNLLSARRENGALPQISKAGQPHFE